MKIIAYPFMALGCLFLAIGILAAHYLSPGMTFDRWMDGPKDEVSEITPSSA